MKNEKKKKNRTRQKKKGENDGRVAVKKKN